MWVRVAGAGRVWAEVSNCHRPPGRLLQVIATVSVRGMIPRPFAQPRLSGLVLPNVTESAPIPGQACGTPSFPTGPISRQVGERASAARGCPEVEVGPEPERIPPLWLAGRGKAARAPGRSSGWTTGPSAVLQLGEHVQQLWDGPSFRGTREGRAWHRCQGVPALEVRGHPLCVGQPVAWGIVVRPREGGPTNGRAEPPAGPSRFIEIIEP